MPRLSNTISQNQRHVRARASITRALLILGLISTTCQPTHAQQDSSKPTLAKNIIDRFERTVAAGVESARDGCLMVAVFNRNDLIWSDGFGFADIEKRTPATARTIGRIGSITKSMTAVVICQLAEQKVLGLDEPIQKYFPEISRLEGTPGDAEAITFRMLASHTSGLIREPRSVRVTAAGPIGSWEAKILESLPATSFKTKPLTEYSYSNIGYGILGLVGSRAANRPYMLMVEKRIFEPLGMESSTFLIKDPELRKRLAVGYVPNRTTGQLSTELPTKEHAGRGYKVPNGGVYSTVGDLAKFAAAMMGEADKEVLGEGMRSEMLRPQAPAKQYGLGFNVSDGKEKWKVVGHSGSVAGYRADLKFDLRSGWGVAALATSRYAAPTSQLLKELVSSQDR